jgi:hypothetical protein
MWLAARRHSRKAIMTKLDAEHRNALKESQFAFPEQRKEPLENAAHVRNAIAPLQPGRRRQRCRPRPRLEAHPGRRRKSSASEVDEEELARNRPKIGPLTARLAADPSRRRQAETVSTRRHRADVARVADGDASYRQSTGTGTSANGAARCARSASGGVDQPTLELTPIRFVRIDCNQIVFSMAMTEQGVCPRPCSTARGIPRSGGSRGAAEKPWGKDIPLPAVGPLLRR